jgi:hypothetical protein
VLKNIKKNKGWSSKKKTQMENNRDYNINQRKKKSKKNVQANSIHRKPYCLQKIEGANTTRHDGRTKESLEPVYSLHEVWKKIRKIYGKRKLHQIKTLIKSNGQSTTSGLEIANKLASQFSKTSFNANYPRNFRNKKEETERQKINIDLSNKKTLSTDHSLKKNPTKHFQNAKDHRQDQTISTMSA